MLCVWVAAGCHPSTGESEPSPAAELRPNVLILLGDTVRADHLSLYGYDRPTTPRIEKRAGRGRVYERAIAPGVWTLPVHASLFTGLAVSAHGVDHPEDALADTQVTIAEVFADAGYDTFAFSANPFLTEENGVLQGFDEIHYAWDERWQRRIGRTIRSRLVPGDVNAERITKEFNDTAAWAYQVAGPTAHRVLVRWLERREPGRPFFAYINYMLR
jgi:arylsulfatase A-like enzyme